MSQEQIIILKSGAFAGNRIYDELFNHTKKTCSKVIILMDEGILVTKPKLML